MRCSVLSLAFLPPACYTLHSTGRRRSKWDQPAPLPTGEAGAEEKQPVAGAVPPAGSQPATDSGSGAGGDDGEAPKVGSQAEAARAAARLNAMLAAQGKLGSGEMVCEGACVRGQMVCEGACVSYLLLLSHNMGLFVYAAYGATCSYVVHTHTQTHTHTHTHAHTHTHMYVCICMYYTT